jgi:[ribosomal protein S5]-alanine N-acetyltransferase
VKLVERLDTARLVGEHVCDTDFGDLCAMNRNPDVMATLGGLRSDDETREYLQLNLDHWNRYGYGLWMLRSRGGGQFVGRSALRHIHIGGRDEIEVGYALLPDFWGRGLATEVAREIVKLAFSDLEIESLVSFTLPTNAASRRVMEKAGGAYERDVVHAGHLHVLYRFGHG